LEQADLSDKTQSGRPVTASDQLHQDRVEEMIRGNRHIKQKENCSCIRNSKVKVEHIMGVLEFQKFCARWVPRKLFDKMKAERFRISREHLERFEKVRTS